MFESIANFIASIIGTGVVIWTIFAVISGYEKEADEAERRNDR